MATNRQLFLKHMAQTSDFPMLVEVERAENIYLYSPEGKRYIDLISGISVSTLGHGHPEVVAAITSQAGKYLHTMVYGEFVQSPQVALAQVLSQSTGHALDSVFFVNSGSEAIEGAMKLARRYTGKTEIISCARAYHGATTGALALGSNEAWKMPFRPLMPDVRHIQFGHLADLENISSRTAAVFIEPVQGEAGVRTAPPAYFQQLKERCQQTGTLLVFDEIQTGLGRTGSFWAYEAMGVLPDILVSAKALGGGLPLGAFMARREIMQVLKNQPVLGHISTFGGNPLSTAAALATISVLNRDGLPGQAEEKGRLFVRHLVHPAIKEVRQKGLLLAVEFESFDLLLKIIHAAVAKGLITDWFLYCDNSLRIAPPLIITEGQIAEACALLLEAIDETV